ncbi:MAG: TatD family hydrolase [Chloroflexota bacterium]
MIISDSHCHLHGVKPEQFEGVLKQARENNVGIIMHVGESLESSAMAIHNAESHGEIVASIGIHPWNAVPPTDEIKKRLAELAGSKHVVAIGEIGLDYARNPQTKETQKELLAYQASFARERGLPVDVHSREAHEDMMLIMRKEVASGLKGIAHGFTGDLPVLKDWLDLGFYISIGVRGFVVKELPHMPAMVAAIPPDRLLTETDSAAVDELTAPSSVSLVVRKLAAIRGTSPEEIAVTTVANLKRILKLS